MSQQLLLVCRDRQGLSIRVEALPTIPEGQITLAVNITNIFDVTSTSQFTFTKHNSSKTPALELDKTLTQFYPSQGFRIVARRLLNDCKMSALGSEVLQWSTDMPNVSLDGVQSNRLVFTPNELLGNVEVGKVCYKQISQLSGWFIIRWRASLD